MEKNLVKGKEKEVSTKELKAQVMQLVQENGALRGELEKASLYVTFRRMDFLFQLIEKKDLFPEETVNKAITELTEVLYPAKEETENK